MNERKNYLPLFLREYFDEAVTLIKEDAIQEIEFSGPTYQVHVLDKTLPDHEAWTFLQLGTHGLTDAFCSCQSSVELKGCSHLAASWLKIYNGHVLPLHLRFESSLWNILAYHYAEVSGCSEDLFVWTDENTLTAGEGDDQMVIRAEGEKLKELKQIFSLSREFKEENSLKFSNLDPEELELWKKGRPSFALQYALSLWCDLARFFMSLQEKKELVGVQVEEQDGNIPHSLQVDFPSLAISYRFNTELWDTLAPALNETPSKLKTYGVPEEGETLEFDPKRKRWILRFTTPSLDASKASTTLTVGRWGYVPQVGFYPLDEQESSKERVLNTEEVGTYLHAHSECLCEGKWLEVHEVPLDAQYRVQFDSEWNLWIHLDLPIAGIEEPQTALFGDILFIPKKGFYFLKGVFFDDPQVKISSAMVSDFVRVHRSFLNHIPGFHVHVAHVDARLTYEVDPQGNLRIVYLLENGKELSYHDFGEWVFVKGQGFYEAQNSALHLKLTPGQWLKKGEVSQYIRANTDLLQTIPEFFSKDSPIKRYALSLTKLTDGSLSLAPSFEWVEGLDLNEVILYDSYLYQKDRGFHALPIDPKIPEELRKPVIIPLAQVDQFLEEKRRWLEPFLYEVDKELRLPESLHLSLLVAERVKSKKKQYRLLLNYVTEYGSLSVKELYAALKTKQRWLFSPAGLIDLSRPRFIWLKEIEPGQIDQEGYLVFSPWEVIRLHAMDPPRFDTKAPKYEENQKVWETLLGQGIPPEPDLNGFIATFRQYQYNGVKWLWHLFHEGLSGLLCDDMGLGKTVQTIGLMAAIKNSHGGRFLVICPTSVLYHWQEKIAQFYPSLKVHIYWGQNRELDTFSNDADLLLTSYGIWRQDRVALSKLRFSLAVFDEIQVAKNHQNQLYASLKGIHAVMRLGLTGTPIENRLRELKALFDLILPGYLPREERFRELFLKPIEKENDPEAKSMLRRMISPFTLRRCKEDVLRDLPDKTEEISYTFLSPQQQALYNETIALAKDPLVEKLKQDGTPVPYVQFFALLSKLKQICDHPACFYKKPDQYQEFESGKWDLFVELIEEAQESGQKVVVFSHFLAMIDMMEKFAEDRGIGHVTLRGSTKNRQDIVSRFQKDPNCHLFFGSLQAAGLGIDLTAASVVIHYDRWWNAARENQATDRVHRIGQKKGVQVFKLVTKNTLEEKIDKMILRKAALMRDMVTVDDQEVLKWLNREELLSLLEMTTEEEP